MALPPSTSDYVRFHALHRPGAIALIDGGREIDYATFHRDLGRFTRALRGFGLPRGALVAVAWESCYLHWLLLLACENLGYVSSSFLPQKGGVPELMARTDLVLCGQDPQAAGAKCHLLTKEWLDGVFGWPEAESDAAPAAPLGPDEPQRLRRSSGTTGGLKMMIGTRLAEERWLETYLLYMGFTPRSRLALTVRFTVASMYLRATACLRLGATCIYDDRSSIRQLLDRHRPTHIRLFQYQMKSLLGALPADYRRPPDLTVMIGAAPLSGELRRSLLDRLASRIIYTYNCNEAGPLASVGDDGVCTLRPGVQAEIVDERGAPLPAGQVGQVRVKTASVTDRYLDNPEATARSFRDGWFHTGDVGKMVGPGRLQLVGRSDELLNIGGLKIAPAEIEETVARCVPVEDIAVTSVASSDGIEEVCIAMVLKNDTSLQACADRIRDVLPRSWGSMRVSAVAAIPRTAESGKVRRDELRKLFTQSKS